MLLVFGECLQGPAELTVLCAGHGAKPEEKGSTINPFIADGQLRGREIESHAQGHPESLWQRKEMRI